MAVCSPIADSAEDLPRQKLAAVELGGLGHTKRQEAGTFETMQLLRDARTDVEIDARL